ncbi:hypothetical protein KVV02_003140 [Mortierella alpina]|uniref:DNA 3'-5' helicase n=1 Tax=Mortierella alpina TaxID=64518 RepID=A0A9P8CV55_MORAP|nr:hypothetical protein KVV02_003140 [Mortierella alpina]
MWLGQNLGFLPASGFVGGPHHSHNLAAGGANGGSALETQAVNISRIPIHNDREPPSNLHEQLICGQYRAVSMSPETATNVRYELLWSEPGWRSRVQAVVIDEAHCISTWGSEFRTAYSRIGEFRSKLPRGTAFVAVSATLHGEFLRDVKRSVHYGNDVTIIRANTDRPNVRYDMQVSNDGGSIYEGLKFVLDLKKTIVYFDDKGDLMQAFIHLVTKVPSWLMKIGCYFADLVPETRTFNMSKFRRGELRILLCTEAAGMGCDISDILRVIQFKFPPNISILAQRLGRAARDPKLQGSGILLYPRSANRRTSAKAVDLMDFLTAD